MESTTFQRTDDGGGGGGGGGGWYSQACRFLNLNITIIPCLKKAS
jgi:hypothetical protein